MPLRRIDSRQFQTDTRLMELGKVIGAHIAAARKAKGWSLEKLAERVSAVSGTKTAYTTISRLEKGERRLTFDWVETIASALGVDPVALIAGAEQNSTTFELSEQVANEVARSLAMVALEGDEPDAGTTQVISLMLQELTATFSAHPQAYRDPMVARPVLDIASRKFSRVAN